MQRKHHLLSKELQANLDDLLRNSVLQLDTMLGYSISNGWLATVNTVLDMRRCLVQAIDLAENDLVQIPHFSPAVVYEVTRGKKKNNAAAGMVEYFKIPEEERKGRFTPNQMLDIRAFGEHIPDIEFTANVAVDGQDIEEVDGEKAGPDDQEKEKINDIQPGDHPTVTFKLVRKNLPDGKAAGPVHAPLFPIDKSESWFIFLCFLPKGLNRTEPILMRVENVESLEKEVEVKIPFMIPRKADPGKHSLVAYLKCDSYRGLDQKLDIEYTIAPYVEKDYVMHPDDKALESQPSFMQQMMGFQNQDDASDNESEPEKKEKKEKAPAADDGDETSDSEIEGGSDSD